jgi:hypothetical protein
MTIMINIHSPIFRSSMRLAIVLSALTAAGALHAQTLTATRTSAFSYYGSSDGAKAGLLKSETVEPDTAQLCVTTTYDYDAYGNKASASTANCSGASGRAVCSRPAAAAALTRPCRRRPSRSTA